MEIEGGGDGAQAGRGLGEAGAMGIGSGSGRGVGASSMVEEEDGKEARGEDGGYLAALAGGL